MRFSRGRAAGAKASWHRRGDRLFIDQNHAGAQAGVLGRQAMDLRLIGKGALVTGGGIGCP
jgi:hypothetical protein